MTQRSSRSASGGAEGKRQEIFNWWLPMVDVGWFTTYFLFVVFKLFVLQSVFFKGRFQKKNIPIIVTTRNSMPTLFKVCPKQSRLITRESDRTGAIRWRLSNVEVLSLLKNQILKSNTPKCIDKSKAKKRMVPFKHMIPFVHDHMGSPACWTWWTGSLTFISTVFGMISITHNGLVPKKANNKNMSYK